MNSARKVLGLPVDTVWLAEEAAYRRATRAFWIKVAVGVGFAIPTVVLLAWATTAHVIFRYGVTP